jgi:hypothetical protein
LREGRFFGEVETVLLAEGGVVEIFHLVGFCGWGIGYECRWSLNQFFC